MWGRGFIRVGLGCFGSRTLKPLNPVVWSDGMGFFNGNRDTDDSGDFAGF